MHHCRDGKLAVEYKPLRSMITEGGNSPHQLPSVVDSNTSSVINIPLRIDNTTEVAFINHLGETVSGDLRKICGCGVWRGMYTSQLKTS